MFSLAIFKATSRATPLLARSLLARPINHLPRSGYASTAKINIDPSHLETYHKDVAKELGEETNSDPDDVLLEGIQEEYDVLQPPAKEVLKHHGTVVEAPAPEIEINVVIRPGEKWDETKAVSVSMKEGEFDPLAFVARTESEEDVIADQFPVKDTEALQELTVEEELALEQRKRRGGHKA